MDNSPIRGRLLPVIRPLRLPWKLILTGLATLLLLGASSIPPGDRIERVRAFTRTIEFDYLNWTLDALRVKFEQLALGTAGYAPANVRSQAVLDYLELLADIRQAEQRLNEFYGNPAVEDPQAGSGALRAELAGLLEQQETLGPLAESALQLQLNSVLAELDLTVGGQSIPPALYRTTSLPLALVVSPRDVIRQDANLSIDPDLTPDEQVALEDSIDASLDVSSLVVPIGGVGLYPTMIIETSDLNWLADVVAHEWTHNFLTLRPLGLNYLSSPELRTINETAASLAGREVGREVIARYYPEHLPPEPEPNRAEDAAPAPSAPAEPPAFDFRAEMRITRLRTDELLAQGKVVEAEAYMEERRRLFWDQGYRLRKLNQAYFAFYGAYADQPGGAAGEDPVGAAVRALRAQSPSLSDFLNRISWVSSYQELQELVADPPV